MVTVASKVFEMVLVMVSSFKQTAKEASNSNTLLKRHLTYLEAMVLSTPSFYWRTAREPRAHHVRRGAHWHLLIASITTLSR